MREILDAAAAEDPRFRVTHSDGNGGIVAASNDALALADGEFVVLLDHDDLLHPDALIEVAEAIDRAPDADYVYTDEDKVDERGLHSGAFFKPGWSPERMRTQMYTCHMSTLRRSLVEEVGGFDKEFEGSQDWDLVLKVTEKARRVLHVPKILYHWRTLAASTASGGEDVKPWAFEAGPRAVQAHCDRIGLPAKVEMDAADPGVLHLKPRLTEEPLVSIVLPSAGSLREIRFEWVVMVENCVRSVVENSTYGNYEIVVVADRAMPEQVETRLAGDRRRAGADRPRAAGQVQLLGDDQHRGAGGAGRVPADAERRHRHHHPRLDRADGDVPRARRRSARSAANSSGATADCSTSASTSTTAFPATPIAASPATYKGYANSVLIARNCLTVTGACLMTRRDLYSSSAASRSSCRSASTTSTTASRPSSPATGSSTTRTSS